MSAYDAIAEWYDAWAGRDVTRDQAFFPTVRELMGNVTGKRILDLACGQGRAARFLVAHGARVTAVDLSEKLLEIARRYEAEQPLGIEYRQLDARSLEGIPDASFDGVLCFQALMDIADLEPTLGAVSRVLRPGGWFVFSVIHPCYNSPRTGEQFTPEGWIRTVGSYFDEGYWRSATRSGPPGRVGAYHRTLATYVNALTDAGLTLERLAEPRATGAFAENRPVWAEVPAVLVAKCQRPALAGSGHDDRRA